MSQDIVSEADVQGRPITDAEHRVREAVHMAGARQKLLSRPDTCAGLCQLTSMHDAGKKVVLVAMDWACDSDPHRLEVSFMAFTEEEALSSNLWALAKERLDDAMQHFARTKIWEATGPEPWINRQLKRTP